MEGGDPCALTMPRDRGPVKLVVLQTMTVERVSIQGLVVRVRISAMLTGCFG